MRPGFRRLRRQVWAVRAGAFLLTALARVVSALPAHWVPRLSSALGAVYAWTSRGSWRICRQNVRAVLGPQVSRREAWRVYRSSCDQQVQAALWLFRLPALTPARYRALVQVPEGVEQHPLYEKICRGAVFVSAHLGNWELLLAGRIAFPDFPRVAFLAEAIGGEAVAETLRRLRSHPSILSLLRKGGALGAHRALGRGEIVAILVDRNVRREQGGIYVPFAGLRARTTPLPAHLALRHQVPLVPIACLPEGHGRHRIWLGPDLTETLDPNLTQPQRVFEVLRRMNAVFEELIRARPDLWTWTLKRFKSRPNAALEGYPPYSEHDRDPQPLVD